MIRMLWMLSSVTRYYLRRYAPSNRTLDAIRSRRGLKWGIPAILIAVPYLLLANLCTALIADGGPAWLNLVVLVSIWNSFKVLFIGPISAILLIRARAREARGRRQPVQSQTLESAEYAEVEAAR